MTMLTLALAAVVHLIHICMTDAEATSLSANASLAPNTTVANTTTGSHVDIESTAQTTLEPPQLELWIYITIGVVTAIFIAVIIVIIIARIKIKKLKRTKTCYSPVGTVAAPPSTSEDGSRDIEEGDNNQDENRNDVITPPEEDYLDPISIRPQSTRESPQPPPLQEPDEEQADYINFSPPNRTSSRPQPQPRLQTTHSKSNTSNTNQELYGNSTVEPNDEIIYENTSTAVSGGNSKEYINMNVLRDTLNIPPQPSADNEHEGEDYINFRPSVGIQGL